MKRVEAIIRHIKVEEVRDALDAIGITGMNFTEVRGSGRQKGYTETYRGARMNIHLIPKVRLETVVEDGDVERVVDCIVKSAQTGDIGDGKIFISPIEGIVRIRTAERDQQAL